MKLGIVKVLDLCSLHVLKMPGMH
uniref:Uncharacterized protein MANES_04G071600 n=1 Tax=Rhizophora mucronata TaxID=61149 RepID=A0A2P2LEI6_RHIMU